MVYGVYPLQNQPAKVKLRVKVRIETPSRLHFTLLDMHGGIGRVDGGIGVALENPRTIVEISPASQLTISGCNPRLARLYAERFLKYYRLSPKVYIHIEEAIPAHVGLGLSTQLALAVASGLAALNDMKFDIREFARVMGRGGTSGVGTAAFKSGGFILDGGHSYGLGKDKRRFLPSRASKAPPAPLLARYALPADWLFVVALPKAPQGAHGKAEISSFTTFCPIAEGEVNRLCRLVLVKVLPAVVERDIASLGSALTHIQRLGFKKVEVQLQHPIIKRLIRYMVENGAYGAGLSSFGPVVYGLTRGAARAKKLESAVRGFLDAESGGEVFFTKAKNKGALITKLQ